MNYLIKPTRSWKIESGHVTSLLQTLYYLPILLRIKSRFLTLALGPAWFVFPHPAHSMFPLKFSSQLSPSLINSPAFGPLHFVPSAYNTFSNIDSDCALIFFRSPLKFSVISEGSLTTFINSIPSLLYPIIIYLLCMPTFLYCPTPTCQMTYLFLFRLTTVEYKLFNHRDFVCAVQLDCLALAYKRSSIINEGMG